MLEIRPSCEHCGKALPPNSEEALICSFECTFCKDCVENILHNVCPNCGGGLQLRPIRPTEKLVKFPPKSLHVYKPVDQKAFRNLLDRFQNIPPNQR